MEEGPAGRLKESVFVIFGSSGNLASTRLIPALGAAGQAEGPRRSLSIIGVDLKSPARKPLAVPFKHVQGDIREGSTFRALGLELGRCPPEAVRIFYLATRPELYHGIMGYIRDLGLGARGSPLARVALEKPFGRDLRSAGILQRELDKGFEESQVYRVDHFLENLVVRRLPGIVRRCGLTGLWDRESVGQVRIRADESSGVGGRGEFYDSTGVVRDMVQNHLLQLLCALGTVSDEPRGPRGAAAGLDLLRSTAKLEAGDFLLGQYRSYRDEKGVAGGSRTPTYFEGKFRIGSDRWRGVPFILRTGKKLRQDLTGIEVSFKSEHASTVKGRSIRWNEVRLRLDRPAGVVFARREGGSTSVEGSVILPGPHATEYDGVVRDLMRGDRSRFASRGFNELAWQLVRLSLKPASEPRPISIYDDGTDGPPLPPGLARIRTNRR